MESNDMAMVCRHAGAEAGGLWRGYSLRGSLLLAGCLGIDVATLVGGSGMVVVLGLVSPRNMLLLFL
jgi:hypothetical protein